MGRNSDECGVSVDIFIADPPHSSERGPQQAGSYGFACVRPQSAAAAPKNRIKAANPHHTAIPVGDVRGYEGMGRNSDECGVSVDIFIADPPHSSERGPQQSGSQRFEPIRPQSAASPLLQPRRAFH
jgi:hypothetical protein